MGIIQNVSSLFTGDAGSGQSKIRQYLIENDWLDAIIQLPQNSFYNTGIATYIWLVTKNKPQERIGKVQLIDASQCYEPRRKSIGNKRVDITDACRELIVRAYGEHRDETYTVQTAEERRVTCKSKMLDNVTFGYAKVVVETPLYNSDGTKVLKRGKPVPDAAKRDTEEIPLSMDIDEYMQREVLPYNPDAWVDASKTKIWFKILFPQTFYEYTPIAPADEIARRIVTREHSLTQKLRDLFEEDDSKDGE